MQRWLPTIAIALAVTACAQQHASSMLPQSTSERAQPLASTASGTECTLNSATLGPPNVTGSYVVNGISASDAWASSPVNTMPNVGAQIRMLHFNGSSWHPVSMPVASPNWNFARVDSIYSIASNNVWAAGEAFYASSPAENSTPFILHWSGTRWLFVRNPPSFQSGHELNFLNITADAANDVWVAAESEFLQIVPGSNPQLISLLHLARYNGTTWTTDTSVPVNPSSEVSGIFAASPQNVWVAMFEFPTGIYHWNGTSLSPQPLPNSNGKPPENLRAITGTGQYDVWTSGDQQYIAHRSASWSPFVVSAGTSDVHQIVAFRPGYAVATTANGAAAGGLLVYNNIDRWRPTTSPFGQYTAWTSSTVVRGTTSFWTDLENLINPTAPDTVGLVVCPPNPPAPLNP